MQWLARISVRRWVFASVMMLAVVVVGLAGYVNLGVDAFPKIDFPVVTVTTRLNGARGSRDADQRKAGGGGQHHFGSGRTALPIQ
jgi:multidrug efflux pump subunit AcrB